MKVEFYKYHGSGNDFILVDNRNKHFPYRQKTIAHLCNRHLGIGADGLICLEQSINKDFKMLYFNADGLEGSMCGNGGRCAVFFAKHLGLVNHIANFVASDGCHQGEMISHQGNSAMVKLSMNDVNSYRKTNNNLFINTGSPHNIVFVDDVSLVDVAKQGMELRYSKEFAPEGANVDFVAYSGNHIKVRTYERGVENETLSCGTGATASALAVYLSADVYFPEYLIETKGGMLEAGFEVDKGKQFRNIWLKGPASFVFNGTIHIDE